VGFRLGVGVGSCRISISSEIGHTWLCPGCPALKLIGVNVSRAQRAAKAEQVNKAPRFFQPTADGAR
jgi:hypothetical protein